MSTPTVRLRTVLEWQKRRLRDHWRRKSEGRPGRPAVDPEIRALIRQISRANPSWGSPRIVGELAKVGIVVAGWIPVTIWGTSRDAISPVSRRLDAYPDRS